MIASRRRLLQSFVVSAAYTPAAEVPDAIITIEALRHVSEAHGIHLGDDRLRVVKPVLEQRKSQLRTLRDFAIEDAVAPTQGTL